MEPGTLFMLFSNNQTGVKRYMFLLFIQSLHVMCELLWYSIIQVHFIVTQLLSTSVETSRLITMFKNTVTGHCPKSV
jgi:hypothetical protein